MRVPFFHGWIIVAVAFVTMGIGVNARTAFSLLFPAILEPWHLYLTLGVLVGGGSVCLGYTGHALFLPNWFVRRRGLAIGIAFSGVGVGSISLLPWVQGLIARAGWRAACWSMGVMVVVALAPLNLLLRRRPEDMGLAPDGDTTPSGAASGPTREANVVDPVWVAVDWTLARALRTARFWWIVLGFVCGLFAWYAVQVHQTKYLIEIGFSPALAAYALGFVGLTGIVGQIVLGHLSDRVGREWAWTLGSVGFVLCYALLLLLRDHPTPALLYLMVASQGMLGYGLAAVFGAIPAEIFQGRHYGTIFGTLSLASILGGALGPWVTGMLYDRSGSYAPAFLIAMACSGVSAIAIWLAAPRKVRVVAGRVRQTPRRG